MVGGQASTRAKPALFVPAGPTWWHHPIPLFNVPETRGSGVQITPQCVSDLQPHSDHGAGGSPVLSGCVHFLNKVSSFVPPLRIIQ
jgi:hypothetical protein